MMRCSAVAQPQMCWHVDPLAQARKRRGVTSREPREVHDPLRCSTSSEVATGSAHTAACGRSWAGPRGVRKPEVWESSNLGWLRAVVGGRRAACGMGDVDVGGDSTQVGLAAQRRVGRDGDGRRWLASNGGRWGTMVERQGGAVGLHRYS